MKIVKFIFSSFWTWLGTLVLLYVPCVCFSPWASKGSESKPGSVKCHFEVFRDGEWVSGEGEFLHWGSDFYEFEAGPGNYTVAIIKQSDGQVVQVLPEKVRFGG